MGLSPHDLVRRTAVPLAAVAAIVVGGALAWLVSGSAGPAQGYTVPTSPGALCQGNGRVALTVLEASLSPADGATVQTGTPVTFSGSSAVPVTFAVASSAALLSSPDIDSGPGSTQPGMSPSTYAFTSTKTTATPQTVYWEASFSTATLNGCEGLSPGTYTTPARTLTVVAAPATKGPEPGPPPPMAPAPAPVQVSIGAPAAFHLAHPTVTYRIHCTASCSGSTSYEVLVLRRHAKKAARVAKLDLRPEAISIAAEAGGEEKITHRYNGSSLRVLQSLVRARGNIELQISVKVTDTSGNVTGAQSTARLRT